MTFSVFAQHTSSCCNIDTTPSDVIDSDSIAKSCLLCKKIQVIGMEDVESVAAEQGVEPSSDQLKYCKHHQDSALELMIKLVSDYKKFSKKKDTNSFKEVLDEVSLLVSANITAQIKGAKAETQLTSGECHDKIDKIELSSQVKNFIKTISKIQEEYNSISVQCTGYYSPSKEEKEITSQMDSLLLLNTQTKK